MCTKCAKCCKGFPFVALSETEIKRLENFTGQRVDEFSNSDRKPVEGYFLKHQEDSSCIFLKEKDGRHACSVYEARPDACQSYPFTKIEHVVCESNWEKYLEENPKEISTPTT